MNDSATLIWGDTRLELPIVEGSEGERAIDIAQLRATTGLITLDPSYGNTGSCESSITFIDGDQGILRYRGIPIEQFASSPNFTEVAWLLIFGRLPTSDEYKSFAADLTENANIDEAMKHHFEGFPRSAPPMAILSAMINTLSCFHPEVFALEDPDRFRAPDQQGAHHCRLRLSPLARAELHVPQPVAALCTQLSAHDVLTAL